MAKVTVIPQTLNPLTFNPINQVTKRRVCAYARVSTDSDEQYTSYEAQCNYYERFIRSKGEWEYLEVYADEGITGTNTKRRANFNRMIADAKAGKIDLIITKSISRFARNTLDTITITRELKALGIEVFFEKENLWTLDSKSELILTIMASIAQEESRSISQNVTVGKRWGMQEGHVSFAYKNFLGYKKENGKIVIDEEQAVLVRRIYSSFLKGGMTCTGIAEMFNAEGIPTPSGRGKRWTKNTVYSILTNEKYKGDALLQKTYIVDYLEHKPKKNEGEIPQYYVENSHPAIILREEWQMVQTELLRRSKIGAKYSGSSIFSSKIMCEDCGGFYGAKVWHSTSKYTRTIYQCNNKFKNKEHKCQTPHLTEQEIKDLFLKAYNEALGNKERIVNDTAEVIDLLTNTTKLDELIASLTTEAEVIAEMVNKLVSENARVAQSQEEYQAKYDALIEKYNKLRSQIEEAQKERTYKLGQAQHLQAFMKSLIEAKEALEEWDDEVWMIMVEKAVVHRNKSVTFTFYNGKEITVK